MKRLSCALLLLTLAACAGSTTDANKDGVADGVKTPNTVSVVAPSTPTGSVSGIVTDTLFAPVGGADVVLALGGATAGTTGAVFKGTTDVDGNFAFQSVPAGGTGEVVISKAGFGTARLNVTVPAAAGNIPIDNANANVGVVALTTLATPVKFFVYGSNGLPAKGATGLLEISPAAMLSSNSSASPYGTFQGVTSVTATVDDSGALTFPGCPSPAELTRIGGQYSLTIGAWDQNADGVFESLGSAQVYWGSSLFTAPFQTIVLPDARQSGPLSIIATNVDSLTDGSGAPFHNAVTGTNPISVAFNQPIAGGALLAVKVVAEDCATNVPVKVEQKGSNLLTITPSTAWAVGAEYHLAIHATGLNAATSTAFVGFFWGVDPAAPKSVSTVVGFQVKKATGNTNTGALQTGDELFVVFDTPVTRGGGSATAFFSNFDLNSSGSLGDGPGESNKDNLNGLPLTLTEQTFDPTASTFACSTNAYGSRWKVSLPTLPVNGVPVATAMKIEIPRDSVATGGFQTVWGQPFSGTYSGSLSVP